MPINEKDQFTAINTPTFLTDLLAKAKDTLQTLGAKGLRVDYVGFDVDGVPAEIYMPKGGSVARITVGMHDDAAQGAIIDMPQVPVGWVS